MVLVCQWGDDSGYRWAEYVDFVCNSGVYISEVRAGCMRNKFMEWYISALLKVRMYIYHR